MNPEFDFLGEGGQITVEEVSETGKSFDNT
jgi:hypothetical protein